MAKRKITKTPLQRIRDFAGMTKPDLKEDTENTAAAADAAQGKGIELDAALIAKEEATETAAVEPTKPVTKVFNLGNKYIRQADLPFDLDPVTAEILRESEANLATLQRQIELEYALQGRIIGKTLTMNGLQLRGGTTPKLIGDVLMVPQPDVPAPPKHEAQTP
jgi:hypothetical protein